jgi:hypothetical protein
MLKEAVRRLILEVTPAVTPLPPPNPRGVHFEPGSVKQSSSP